MYLTHAQAENVLTLLDIARLLRSMLRGWAYELTGLTRPQALILCRIDLNGGAATTSDLSAAQSWNRQLRGPLC